MVVFEANETEKVVEVEVKARCAEEDLLVTLARHSDAVGAEQARSEH